MGHPSDWDEVRSALPEFETFAIAIKPTSNWNSSIRRLTESISHRSILVGYSMGARLALGMALEHPDQFDGLVLISGNPGLESQEARDQRQRADEQVARRIEDGNLKAFLEQWYQADVFSGLPEAPRNAEIERKLIRDSSDWPAILRTNSVSQQPNFWPRLNELSMPVVVVAGERDEKYKEIAIRFERGASRKSVASKVIPDCGHIMHREQPQALIRIIRDLLESQSQPEA
jgi:2-succinyl-6-hydroxy-2,4-cyclohexadiene-1-carboxylate synthase